MEKLTEVFPIRVSKSQLERIRAAAEAEGRPAANFARYVLDMAARGKLQPARKVRGDG